VLSQWVKLIWISLPLALMVLDHLGVLVKMPLILRTSAGVPVQAQQFLWH
jgi:hypothetical protein